MWLANRISKIQKLLATLILILIFQTPSQADDIRDFQIEGMSLGDSLLDYFSEEEIKTATRKVAFKSNKFYRANFYSNLKVFDSIMFYLKTDDNNYKVYSINAALNYSKQLEECNKKKNLIVEELKSLFENYKINIYSNDHPQDKTGESKFHSVDFNFENGADSRVMCIDWSSNFEKDGFYDHLRVIISLKEFVDFIQNEAY